MLRTLPLLETDDEDKENSLRFVEKQWTILHDIEALYVPPQRPVPVPSRQSSQRGHRNLHKATSTFSVTFFQKALSICLWKGTKND